VTIPPTSSGTRPTTGDPVLAAAVRANRTRLKLSQEALAKLVGVSKGFISGIENSEWGASRESLQKFARVFGCSIDELLHPDPSPRTGATPAGSYTMVQRYNVTGGLGNARINEHHIEVEADYPIPTALIERSGWRIESLCVIQTKGDSMDPNIHNGDPVVVNRDEKTVESGRVYAFIDADGGVSIKRLHRERDGRIRVTSDNPNKMVYPDSWISPSDRVEIIGKVVHRSGAP
jgi:phage repressor protein C with HTH and peptisase S24 domain